MSLSYGITGEKIAKINDKNNKKMDGLIIRLFDELNNNNSCDKNNKILPYPNNFVYDLSDKKNSKFVILPQDSNINKANHILVIGQTGSGKSNFIKDYLNDINHDRTVYIFNSSDKTEPYDKPDRIRINLNTLKDNNLTLDLLSNSVCIFDDIDGINDTDILKIVKQLQMNILENGRKYNIWSISTTHNLYNGKNQGIINEVQYICVFHQAINSVHLINFLKSLGVTNKGIKYIRKLSGRHILIYKSFPSYLISEKSIIVLNKLDSYLDDLE